MAVGITVPPESRLHLDTRAVETLSIMHRWGYAPTVGALAAQLLGGDVAPDDLVSSLDGSARVCIRDDFVYLRGYEELVEKSKRRVESHAAQNGKARGIAREFATDLVRFCPFVRCVALSGSAASGGYQAGDDIDFDLFVDSGTKYASYLMAVLVGLRYSWRYRHGEVNSFNRTPILPKITCINVVWPEDTTRPFARQDPDLAFELARCLPLYGAPWLHEVLKANGWIRGYFPQLYDRTWEDEVSRGTRRIGRILEALARQPRLLRALERVSRKISWTLYRFVQWSRRTDAEARERVEFLRRVKWPYEVFQD